MVVVVCIGVRDCQGFDSVVRNSEPAFLALIYYCSPDASLIRNKFCWPDDADSLCRHRAPEKQSKSSSTESGRRGTDSERVSNFDSQIVGGVRKYRNGSFLPKFGNPVQSDHLVTLILLHARCNPDK